MKRELPKNVRQIGNVSDSSKIYVEDYVDTYLNQLCEKADQALVGAFLIGEIVQEEEDYIYVYGAIQMSDIGQKGRDVTIGDSTWKSACETCKKYFGSAEILGWFLTSAGLPLECNHNLMKVHQKFFSREKSILILKEAREKEEKYFIHKFRNLMECSGHYIYYEKNDEMQDYMIANRKLTGMSPSETIEDTAIKSFRSIIQGKMEKKEKKENSRTLYVLSTALVLILLVMGVAKVNDYGRMNALQAGLDKQKEEKEEETVPVLGEVSSISKADDEKDVEAAEVPVSENEIVEEPEIVEQQIVDEEMESSEDSPYKDGVYVVEKGDTLAIISRKVYGDLDHINALCSMNGLGNGNLILVGQKLLLP